MKYALLLRGVNIGGRTIKSADLRACFEAAGFEGADTVLQTGNVLIESAAQDTGKLKRKIEKLLEESFGYSVSVQVVGAERLAEIIKAYPFRNVGRDMHRYVIFVERGMEGDLAALGSDLDDAMEAVRVGNGVVYWRVLKGNTLDSAFGKRLAKFSATNFTTTRNMNTLEKVSARFASS